MSATSSHKVSPSWFVLIIPFGLLIGLFSVTFADMTHVKNCSETGFKDLLRNHHSM